MTVVQLGNSKPSSYAQHIMTKHPDAGGKASNGTAEGEHSEDKALSLAQLGRYQDEFNASIRNRLATLTLSREAYSNGLENRYVTLQHPAVFSHKLKISPPITNQKSSGRCWIFACLNMLRLKMMEEYKLEELELSQPFVFFYDKLEKSNWFLENVLSTLDEELDGRVLQYLLTDPINDGGQFDMIVALLEKYGVVPKEAYPETFHTSNSREMDTLITSRLREFAKQLRQAHADGCGVDALRQRKQGMLEQVHRIMTVSLGQPPEKVTWAFYDKDKNFHEFRDLTPQEFYRKHVKVDCTRLVSLINDPRNEYMRKYTVQYLGNVAEAGGVRYVNLSIDDIKQLASRTIQAGRPVWFGCDVGKCFARGVGLLDPQAVDLKAGFDVKDGMSKADRLRYGESAMTHAMLLTGVHVEDGRVVRWRVENSWGEASGVKGYLTLTDEWFSEFVYQIVLDKGDLPQRIVDVLDQDAVVLPPWDPMGALAQ
ncbi:bleomycin hydrolase [Coemansia sp. RSA 2336]|nr:bleomycin hydrolase [Coemansia sp. RSA 2336]